MNHSTDVLEDDKNIHGEEYRFLQDFRYFPERMRLNSKLKYVFLLILLCALTFTYLFSEVLFLDYGNWIYGFLWFILFYSLLYVGYRIRREFERLMFQSLEIFKNRDVFELYIDYTKKSLNPKREGNLSFTIATFGSCGTLIYLVAYLNPDLLGYSDVFENSPLHFGVLALIFWAITYFYSGGICASAFFFGFNTFNIFMKLGTKEFPISLNYKDLKSNSLIAFGKRTLFMCSIFAIMTSVIGIIGLIYIIIYNDMIAGLAGVLLGFIISIILLYIFFKLSIHLHNIIVGIKSDLKTEILSDIQITLDDSPSIGEKYDTLHKMHSFYNEIENINEWPFNLSSILKLTFSVISAFFPFIFTIIRFIL
ncbi:MAG: hypothetical protein ACFFCS_09625 [Candidatus Hodarchaeota archaeon]